MAFISEIVSVSLSLMNVNTTAERPHTDGDSIACFAPNSFIFFDKNGTRSVLGQQRDQLL